jgi:hypothetical protein
VLAHANSAFKKVVKVVLADVLTLDVAVVLCEVVTDVVADVVADTVTEVDFVLVAVDVMLLASV